MSSPLDSIRKLKSILPIDGDLQRIPKPVLDTMRQHIFEGGEEDFATNLWSEHETILQAGDKRADFLFLPTGTPMRSTRFPYGIRSQIVVAAYPETPNAPAHAVVITPVTPFKLIENVPNHEGWYASAWKVWEPSSLQLVFADNETQIVRAIEPNPKVKNVLSAAHKTPSRTLFGHKLDLRQSSVDAQSRSSFSRNEPRNTDTTERVQNSLKREFDGDEDEPKDEANFEPLSKQRRLVTPSSTSADAPSETEHTVTGTASEAIQSPLTPSLSSGQQAAIVPLRARPAYSTIQMPDLVKFVFVGENGDVKGAALLADCSSAADLFDEACTAEIVDLDTRMLKVKINGGREIRFRANKEGHFQDKLMARLQKITDDEPNGTIRVEVMRYY